MDYIEYAETELVRSNLATGSMTTAHVSRLIMAHAVARSDDGTLNKTTECGMPASFRPDEEPRPWPSAHMLKWCQQCAKTAGGVLINGVTGEPIVP